MCECLCNFHIFLSTVQFWDGSVRDTKNNKAHLKKFIASLFYFTTLSFSEHHQKLFNILHNLILKTVEVYFPCSTKKTILIYFTISM